MNHKEETLDPENWDEMRTLGHKMLDEMMDTLDNSETFPFRFPSKEDIENILIPLSEEGDGEEATYQIFKEHILPSTFAHTRPKWWALVAGTGSPYGMLTDMLTSGTNLGLETMLSSFYTHKQVVDWVKELLEYPRQAGGVLVNGGSEANFTGLAVADFRDFPIPILTIIGSRDPGAPKQEGFCETISDSAKIFVIEGGNHRQYADYSFQRGDGVATISSAEQQNQIIAATVQFLDTLN
jgi:hypothetical protein